MTAEPSTSGRAVLVTGALGGIGAAIIEAFVTNGDRVALHHLGEASAASVRVAEIEATGADALAVDADVTSWESVRKMIRVVLDQLGRLDILVNAAGVVEPGEFLGTDLEQWRRTIDVDLTGVFVVSRLAVPAMLSTGGGSIVNVASQLAVRPAADNAAYSAAKAGVLGLTRAMSRELGPEIRVNAIAPGPVKTPMIAGFADAQWVAARTGDLVIGRLAEPAEIAASVLYLASPSASLMHGQTLHINGGGYM